MSGQLQNNGQLQVKTVHGALSVSINCVITKEKELMKIAGNQKRDQEVVPGPFIYYNAHKKRKVLKTKMKLDFLKIFDNFKIFLFKKVS